MRVAMSSTTGACQCGFSIYGGGNGKWEMAEGQYDGLLVRISAETEAKRVEISSRRSSTIWTRSRASWLTESDEGCCC
jgi:hypothetical protein